MLGIKTEVLPTQLGELTFKKFQNVNEHLLTSYLNFETTHEEHKILCHVCDELRERSFSKLFKKKVSETCIKEKHPKPHSFLCDGCLDMIEFVERGVFHITSI